MSTLIPYKALNRSQSVDIAAKKTSTSKFALLNVDSPRVQRDLARHTTLGAIIPVGAPIWQGDDGIVLSGGTVAVRATGLVVDVAATGIRTAAGVESVAPATTATIGAADGTNPRVDTIALNTATGAAVVIAGTAVAGAQIVNPAAPTFRGTLGALPAARIVLAYVLVPATVTNLLQTNVLDARP
jgi:hypothetical protein